MIASLINNLALLLSLSICHIFILRRWHIRTAKHNIFAGVLFGAICIAGMMNPLKLIPGIIFDGRSIVASVVSFFYGPVTALVLVLIGCGYRIWIGGGGVYCGVGVICTSGLIGVLYHYLYKQDLKRIKPLHLYLFGIIVHLSMMAWMLILPITSSQYLSVAVLVILLFPGAEMLLGLFLLDQEKSVLAVKRLQESEKHLRDLVENVPVGIAINDYNTNVEYLNEEFSRITGYTLEDIPTLEDWWTKAYPDPTYRETVKQCWISLLEKAINNNLVIEPTEVKVVCKNQKQRTLMIQGINVDDKIYIVFHDITEQEQMRSALDKERRFLETVLDTIDDGIIACDTKGALTVFNQASKRMHGLSEEDGEPGRWDDPSNLYHADGQTRLEKEEIPLFRTLCGDLIKNEEIVIHSNYGNPHIVTVNGQSLVNEHEQKIGAMVSLHDITLQKQTEQEKKLLQEQLLQSQKMEAIGQLAGGIAHDFNNLLMAIKGYSELILIRLEQENPIRNDIHEIMKAGDRAAALTHQLLAFSRKQILQPAHVNLNELVLNTENMLHRLIGEDIELVTVLDPQISAAFLDPHQGEQIILNLAVNARDAMPVGGKLTIETANVFLDEEYAQSHSEVTPGPHVMLAISDTGSGMDREILSKIFDPFFTTKKKGKGTGLGLSTVYGIVKQSNGNIWVYSELGKGTTFKVYFPAVDGPVVKENNQTEKSLIIEGSETILLVEDEDTLRRMITRVLEEKGYTVIPAGFGTEALQLCNSVEGQIHLLLTDVVMPKMSGRVLAERIVSRYPSVKILYMSGYTDNAIVHHGVLDRGVQFVQKPILPQKLLQKIREVLDA